MYFLGNDGGSIPFNNCHGHDAYVIELFGSVKRKNKTWAAPNPLVSIPKGYSILLGLILIIQALRISTKE